MAFETFNLGQILNNVDQSKAMQLRNRLLEGQMQQEQKQAQSKQNLNNVLRGAVGKDGRLDRGVALSRLYEADPLQAMQFEQQFSAQDAVANKERREQSKFDLEQRSGEADLQGKLIERGRNWFAQANNQAGWDAARQWLQANNLPVDQVPAEYSIENKRAQVTKADDWLKSNVPNYQQIDQGGKKTFVDTNPLTNPNIGSQSFERTLTPAEIESQRHNRASENIQNANLRIAQAREAREGKGGGMKAPAGYRYAADGQSLEPIPGGPAVKDKAPTETQAKAATFGERAAQADAILNALEGDYSQTMLATKMGLQDMPLTGGLAGAAWNSLFSGDKAQQVEQARRDFVNATLRQESGAAIARSEFANADKQYFPQPGDSEAVIQQKAQNRQAVIQGFRTTAGSAGQSLRDELAKELKIGDKKDGWFYTGKNPADRRNWKAGSKDKPTSKPWEMYGGKPVSELSTPDLFKKADAILGM